MSKCALLYILFSAKNQYIIYAIRIFMQRKLFHLYLISFMCLVFFCFLPVSEDVILEGRPAAWIWHTVIWNQALPWHTVHLLQYPGLRSWISRMLSFRCMQISRAAKPTKTAWPLSQSDGREWLPSLLWLVQRSIQFLSQLQKWSEDEGQPQFRYHSTNSLRTKSFMFCPNLLEFLSLVSYRQRCNLCSSCCC